jgi:hypothetical protein
MNSVKLVILGLVSSSLTACSADVLNKKADSEDKALSYSLVRVYSNVKRTRCDGSLISEGIEMISDSKKLVRIEPDVATNFYSASFKNLTNGKSPGCMVDKTKFNINITSTACDMKVEQGINRINYKFAYCNELETKQDANGQPYQVCKTTPDVREQGDLYINVSYSEEMRPGTLEYKEACPTN